MQGGGPPAPPTSSWALDASRPTSSGGETAASDVHEVATAWKHCKNVAREDGRTPDLYDLLSHSVRETQYSFPPQGWPCQIRMLSPVLNEMPPMVMDRYKACQTVAFCGVFPELRRAWASVDNSLFLWRFDKWQDVPVEYSGEEQAIVSVGLCTPRTGVFVEAVRYVLVICTATEIVLLGVCCTAREHECDEITIQTLPLYTVPSDNVAMTSVKCTAMGRILLGGADGNLYEIKYAATDSWRSKRCTKVCHTGGIRQLLPSFLPEFLFGAPQALVDLVVDDQRHVLYTRSQASALQVYDLGADGTEAPRRVAEVNDFLAEAVKAWGGREVFGRGAGDKKGAAIVYMVPIPASESRRLHLLTVTADGRRVYWGAASSRSSGGLAGPRPDRLRPEIARQAIPSPTATSRATGGSSHAPSRGLEVMAACYASGALLLAEGVPGEARTRLFLLSRDLTIPPVGTATGAHVAVAGLRESIAELPSILAGEVCAIRSIRSLDAIEGPSSFTSNTDTTVRDELTTQNAAPPPRYAIVTTAGIVEVEKLRPADVLAQLLQGAPSNQQKLELFFSAYAPQEAAAMCIQLAASSSGERASADVVARAAAALDDPRLCGEPVVRDEVTIGDAGLPAEEPAAHFASGFDMGAVVPVAEPEWSAAHKGLCLYVSRLLQPVWDETIAANMRSSSSMLRCLLPTPMLVLLENKLRGLEGFVAEFIARRKARRRTAGGQDGGPYASAGAGPGSLVQPAVKRQRLEDAVRLELRRIEGVRALVARAADACFLLRALTEHNLSRLSARLEEPARAMLRTLRFRDLVSTEEGEAAAAQLIAVLVSEHLGAAAGLVEDLIAALQGGCPSYFRSADRTYYAATGLLRRAEAATAVADRDALTRDAVAQLVRVPLACDLGVVVPQLAGLRAMDAAVELTARKAAALDPINVAAREGPEGETARSRREELCYTYLIALLRVLSDHQGTATRDMPPALTAFASGIGAGELGSLRSDLLRQIAATQDPWLHEATYAALIDMGAIRDVLHMGTPSSLERYLVRASGLGGLPTGEPGVGPLTQSQATHGDVLARFYIGVQEYAAAAGVYELLASRSPAPAEFPDPSLETRMACLEAAVLQARSCGDAGLVDRLETKLRVARVQGALTEALLSDLDQDSASHQDWEELTESEFTMEETRAVVSELRRRLFSLEDLYNDVSRPSHRWAACLELLDISAVSDPPYVRQLWDLYLKSEWQSGWAGRERDPEEARAARALRAAAEAASSLGERFFPNESSFPASQVLLRLEQAAAGLWPRPTGVELDSIPAQQALLAACGGSYEGVVRAYEGLLSARPSDPHGDELAAPPLRLRLLQSLRDVVVSGRDRLADRVPLTGGLQTGQGGRELRVFAAACEAFAPEARHVPGGDGLAEEFRALGVDLLRLMGYNSGVLG